MLGAEFGGPGLLPPPTLVLGLGPSVPRSCNLRANSLVPLGLRLLSLVVLHLRELSHTLFPPAHPHLLPTLTALAVLQTLRKSFFELNVLLTPALSATTTTRTRTRCVARTKVLLAVLPVPNRWL